MSHGLVFGQEYTDEEEIVPEIAPIGKEGYLVRPGDCMASIAHEHGFFWKTLWTLPENEALRTERVDPNALLPGDRVWIPKLRLREEKCATTRRHTFRLKTTPVKLRVRFTRDPDEPRASLPYTIEIGTVVRKGETDGDGVLEEWVPAGAKEAKVVLRPEKGPPEELVLAIGHLAPEKSHHGIADRLVDLGFMDPGDDLEAVISAFQVYHGLPVTGLADDDLLRKITDEFTRTG